LIEPAQSLPSVSLTRPDGQPVRLAAVPGKVMLINVWATWCAACRIDLPLLNRFHEAADARVWLTSSVHQCA
jgi:thiol-disulfide isomerase/thioredoxin